MLNVFRVDSEDSGKVLTQPAFIFLKSTVETAEQHVQIMVRTICSKLTIKTPKRRRCSVAFF